MRHRLSPDSRGVASHSRHRTRLRVPPKYRQSPSLDIINGTLKKISGVNQVEINKTTGSILVHHETQDQILEQLSQVFDESAPELLTALVEPEIAWPELMLGFLRNLISEQPANDTNQNHQPSSSSDNARTIIPLAFLTAGIVRLLEQETLLGATAPLVLFYYAFDTYWKFQQTGGRRQSRPTHAQAPVADATAAVK